MSSKKAAGLPQFPSQFPSISPSALSALQSDYLAQATALWNESLKAGAAETKPLPDRRFANAAWSGNPASSFVAQMYLLNSKMLQRMAEQVEGDDKLKQRVKFGVQQWIDAASPSNYLALNPEAQALAVSTQGESLSKGLQQLWGDVQRGHVSQTDESAFEVGRNVATTEGSIVFENELFQLIEYKPLTKEVYERPLLMIPPCINKFYILDLQPDNSLIRYSVEQGHRTFVVSWRNPDASCKAWTWDDYIEKAAIRAIEVVREIGGTKTIDTLGFCVGGTILATALGVLASRGEHPAESVTLLTTLLDFSSNGILDIFIDEPAVQLREVTLGDKAPGGPELLKGQELATTFSFLRPNDLVWNYVVGNYLKGEAPPPFDLLYWNGDATNLPGPMYCWYLRHTYLQNELREPGKLIVCGEQLDLSKIKAPVYIYGSREDHIVPWDSAYRSTQVLSGKKRFVLGASGHIAGVINPPAKKKRSHWIGKAAALPADHQQWFDGAVEHPGSWWTDWSAWLASHAGAKKPAPKSPGNRTHKAIEPAPGRYVKQKA
ncbi:class I poly(R)-hydroxyalkanoic acid synthase [Paucibacter sp. R3-3]|uniref:Class I poly(R)-hydroxyalkanoic acid synthase n=1 Tax=Roseateles agri TaxID=3098619 RepID=A0ABU5DNA9_9BURK|nr:class I poly(R)-hydroxyalkanoic acid synthase [Paucibacter sp. R3-3]MDY0747802.1 class I poly(R)-hydroxyalkanoic acid synthase [Paucibacter sp. R3-3]